MMMMMINEVDILVSGLCVARNTVKIAYSIGESMRNETDDPVDRIRR